MPEPGGNVELVLQMPRLPARPADAHKGMFGAVLVIAGSRGMSGAAILCSTAALRGGAGLVRVAVPAGVLDIVACGNPCYMTAALPQDDQGRLAAGAETELHALLEISDVLAVGPGLGRGDGVQAIVSFLLQNYPKPIVLDADGLNALVGRTEELSRRTGPLVLTPHPGEFARLAGVSADEVQAKRSDLAIAFAAKHNLVLVLKGNETIVTDGRRFYQNTSGNAGMATGGSGDVLTGLIAALIGQKLPPFEAAQLGVCVHGRAGDLAREELGEVSLIATDLVDFLPAAFQNG